MSFPGQVEGFRDEWLPESATPAGYAALIDAYGLRAALPRSRSAISAKHGRHYQANGWTIWPTRRAPESGLYGHLEFALKHEGVDLLVLKKLFDHLGDGPIEDMVRNHSAGIYARRLWFFYEWLTGRRLDLGDATSGAYVDAIDSKLQWDIKASNSTRHRVRDNVPGTPKFSPLVHKTPYLVAANGRDLANQAKAIIADVPADVLARTAAFLLLKDSESSFEIEGARPGNNRIAR